MDMISKNVFIFYFQWYVIPLQVLSLWILQISSQWTTLKLNILKIIIKNPPLQFRTHNAAFYTYMVLHNTKTLCILLQCHEKGTVCWVFITAAESPCRSKGVLSFLIWTEPWSCWKSNLMIWKKHMYQFEKKTSSLSSPKYTQFMPLYFLLAATHVKFYDHLFRLWYILCCRGDLISPWGSLNFHLI